MKQSKDYRYPVESYVFYTLPFIILQLILEILIQIDSIRKPADRILIIDWELHTAGWAITAIFICIALYSYSCRQKRSMFLASNLFYTGTIVKYECVDRNRGRGSRYYCYIQFERKGKKEILRSQGYAYSPDEMLASPNCTVYELNGEFYPANFVIRSRYELHINIPH